MRSSRSANISCSARSDRSRPELYRGVRSARTAALADSAAQPPVISRIFGTGAGVGSATDNAIPSVRSKATRAATAMRRCRGVRAMASAVPLITSRIPRPTETHRDAPQPIRDNRLLSGHFGLSCEDLGPGNFQNAVGGGQRAHHDGGNSHFSWCHCRPRVPAIERNPHPDAIPLWTAGTGRQLDEPAEPSATS